MQYGECGVNPMLSPPPPTNLTFLRDSVEGHHHSKSEHTDSREMVISAAKL
jgi:hypothetical protein